MKKPANYLTRRELLKGTTQAGLAGALMPLTSFAHTSTRKEGLIAAENKKPGTTDWQLVQKVTANFLEKCGIQSSR